MEIIDGTEKLFVVFMPPYGEVDGVGPEEEHEDDDDAFLDSDDWLWYSSLVGRGERGCQ